MIRGSSLVSRFAEFSRRSLAAALIASFAVVPLTTQPARAGAEPVLEARIPDSALNYTLRHLLVTRDSVIKRLDDVVLSPVDGSISVTGQIELPAGLIHSLEDRAGGEIVPQTHDFQLSITPKVLNLDRNSYLKVTLNHLSLNGQDFSQSFPVFSNFIKIFLSYTDLKRILANRAQGEQGESVPEGTTLPEPVARLLQTKSIRFTPGLNSVTLRLNLSEFINLGAYQSMVSRLRLWHLGPMRESATADTQVYVAIGEGRPPKYWEDALQRRKERDAEYLRNRARERIAGCCSAETVRTGLESYYIEQQRNAGLLPISPREMRELERGLDQLKQSIDATFTLDNPEFAADPEGFTARFRQEAQGRILSIMDEAKRRHDLMTAITGGGRTSYAPGNAFPYVVKRLSQRALSGIVRYFRDIKANGENLFKDLDVILAPQLPGLVIRGSIRVDLNQILQLSSDSHEPMRLNSDLYGEGVPFELSTRLYMEDNGWLRIDVESVRLLSGREALYFDRTRPNGRLLINVAQALIDKSLVGAVLNGDNFLNNEQIAQEEERQVQDAKRKLLALPGTYQRVQQSSAEDDVDLLQKLVTTDLQSDPFIAQAQGYIERKVNVALDHLLVYDRDRKSFRLSLNPELISSLIGMRSQSEVWNVEPVYDKNRGKAYLELSVGNGARTNAYVRALFNRPEYFDSQEFTAEPVDDRDSSDFALTLGTEPLTQFVNEQLRKLEVTQRAQADAEMRQDHEQTHVIVKDFDLGTEGDHALRLRMSVELVEKNERSAINPARWFGDRFTVSRDNATATMIVEFKTGSLEQYKNGIANADRSLFLGDEVLVLDVTNASVDTTKYAFLQKVVGLVLDVRNVDFRSSRIAGWLKRFALKKIIPMLDDPNHVDNTMMGDFALNRLVKFHLHDSEILLQINPRLYSSAFEVTLIPQRFGPARGKGMTIDPAKKTLSLDFTVNSSLAGYDRDELSRVMARSRELYAPYLRERSPERLARMFDDNRLWDQTFYNSDESRKSVFHRFMATLERYPDLIDVSGMDADKIRQTPPSRIATETGFELMYFASAAFAQYEPLNRLVQSIQRAGIADRLTQGHYFNEFVARRDLLRDAYITPFLEAYRQKFEAKDRLLLSRGTTDWNFKFFSDAAFSVNAYERLSRAVH